MNFKHASLFNGDLDIGMDLTPLQINFENREIQVDRMKSPFPSMNETNIDANSVYTPPGKEGDKGSAIQPAVTQQQSRTH